MSEQWSLLIDKLQELVQEKKISWRRVDDFDGFAQEYAGDLADRTIFIGYDPDGESFYISIRENNGQTIDSFTDDELKEETSYTYTTEHMRRLFNQIARQYSGADEKLAAFLRDIGV